MPVPALRGFVFDMDGTLLDSGLDFHAIRQEMGLPDGDPILETMRAMPERERQRCAEILHRHEWAGANRATPMPGVREFLAALERRNLPRAVLTRNGRELTLAVLARLKLTFDLVLSREDGPAKPHPAPLLAICARWGLAPEEVAMIGDFHYDIQVGRNAGACAVLYTAGEDKSHLAWAAEADLWLHSFHDAETLFFGNA